MKHLIQGRKNEARVGGAKTTLSIFNFSAILLLHPALVSMSQNTDMIVSIVLGHTVLHLAPSFLELLGAGLILISVTGIAWLRWKNCKKEYENLLNAEND